MWWASALSTQAVALRALQEVVDDIRGALDTPPDVVILFVSAHHAHETHALVGRLREAWPGAEVLGCTGGGILGAGSEQETAPCLSVLAATLPGVRVEPLRLTAHPEADTPDAWRRAVGIELDDLRALLILPAPFTTDSEALVRGLDLAYPGVPKIGGIASGFSGPGEARLVLGGQTYRDGMVGLALCGNLAVDTVVAQGCRPVGEPMIVTRFRDNVIEAVDKGRPDEMIRRLFAGLSPRDRVLFQDSLFVGVEMTDKVGAYQQGDFLIRSVIGVDPQSGAMAVGAPLSEYQVVQFQLRDARTSTEDLQRRLQAYRDLGLRPAGALLFSCLGRGSGLYGEEGHDSRCLREALGDLPVAGFFCNGEIGPVAGRTFVHGYTSAIALFRPREG